MSDPNPYASPIASEPSKPTPTHVRYLVLFWLSMLAAIVYMQRSINAVEQTIRDDLDISKSWMGFAMSAFFITYAVFQIPTGWLADRWGSRKTLVLVDGGQLAAAAVVGAASGIPGYYRPVGNGNRAGGHLSADDHAIAQLVSARRADMASGVLTGSMSAGGAAATPLTGGLLAQWDWRSGLCCCSPRRACCGRGGFGRWFRDAPADHPAVGEQRAARDRRGSRTGPRSRAAQPMPWRLLLSSGSMWLINVQQFCRAAGYVFFVTWFHDLPAGNSRRVDRRRRRADRVCRCGPSSSARRWGA